MDSAFSESGWRLELGVKTVEHRRTGDREKLDCHRKGRVESGHFCVKLCGMVIFFV